MEQPLWPTCMSCQEKYTPSGVWITIFGLKAKLENWSWLLFDIYSNDF